MAISYDWKVIGLRKTKVDNIDGVIIGTQWHCIGTDEFNDSGKFLGSTPFQQIDPNNFIPYDELTEQIVISWIQQSVTNVVWSGSTTPPEGATGTYWEHVQGQIQKQIDSKKNPVIDVNAFPWDQSTNT